MSDSFIEPDILNTGLISIDAYVDDSGNNKLVNGQLSSSNFDGLVPLESTTLPVSDIKVGMSFLPLGDTEGTFRTVYQIDFDDPEINDDPSNEYILYYIGDNNEIQTVTYDKDDVLEVNYENIDDIFLGSTGWTITQGGNAIFSNIFARGRIEATEGFLENLGITGTLTVDPGGAISVGSQITIDEFGITATNTSGSTTFFLDAETGAVTIGGYATEEDIESASVTLQYLIDNLNESISASIGDIYIDLNNFSASIDFLYDAGFLVAEDLSDTGTTTISGNRIRTGIIDVNLVNVFTSLLPNRGIKLSPLGLEGFNSSGQRTFYLNTNGSLDITGYATDSELSSGLDGKIDDGGAAADVNNNTTNISGGKIRTGIIESNSYSGVTDGTAFSSSGLAINLTTGALTSEAFRIDANGNASFKGNLQALSGYFGNATYGITIGNNGSQVGLETTTLKLGSANISGIRYGNINFYTTGGISLGTIAATNSNKNWSLYGDGVGFGTPTDYFLLPGSNNSNKARYFGNGFEWYGSGGSRIMAISGGTGGLRIENNTGGIIVSGGGNIEVTGTGKFVGDGSGLTNLPGGSSGGVTELKFGANQLWRTGRVYIDSASIVSALESNSIPNGKLINSSITIGSTTRNLGGTFAAGDIDGDVITANSLPTGKISNSSNLISIGTTGIPARSTITSINGLSKLQITGNQGLDYVTNLGTSPVNLNRAANPMTLNGVKTASATIADSLRNLPRIEGLSGNGIIVHGLGGLLAGLNYTSTESNKFLQVNSSGTALQWATFSGLTNPMTAFGDLIYGGTNANPSVPARLPVGATGSILKVSTSLGLNIPSWLGRGTAGQVLRVNSGGTDIEWGTLTAMTNPMTSVGDIIYGGTGGVPTRLPAGQNGQFLQYSTTNNRPTWVTFSSLANPMSAAGQMIYGSTSGTPAAVPAGTSGQVLKSGGAGAPTWSSSLFTLGGTTVNSGATVTALSGITLNQEITVGVTNAASNGNVLVKGGTGLMRLGGTNIGSTIRIKENITTIDNDERIYSLRPVSFYLKKEHQLASAIETASAQIGFIAEEVFEVIPEAIQYSPESNEIWNYSERAILALAVKAIQDQKNKIDSLENTIAILEARLDAAGL